MRIRPGENDRPASLPGGRDAGGPRPFHHWDQPLLLLIIDYMKTNRTKFVNSSLFSTHSPRIRSEAIAWAFVYDLECYGAEARMNLDFYQLKEQPFAASPEARFLFLSDTHRQALGSLLRAIQADRGFVTLTGQPGLGKTTLLFHILRSLGDKVSTIYIFQAVQAPVDLLRAVLADLGVHEINEDPEEMLCQLKAMLSEEQRVGKRVVVVIDEAQNLGNSVFRILRLLSDLETPQGRLIQFILCGRPMLSEKLTAIKPMQWMQGGESVAHLEPFTPQDTAQYLDHRLRMAGYDRQVPLFTPEAARLVADYSQGTPRIINTLCSEALSTACRHKREQIGGDTVREAAATLNLAQPKRESVNARPPQVITMPLISRRGASQLAPSTDYVTAPPAQKAPAPLRAEATEAVVVAFPSEAAPRPQAVAPIQSPPSAPPAPLNGVTRENVVPLRPSAVAQSPRRKNGIGIWSLVPRPFPGLAAAAVLFFFLTGVVFGRYHPKISHPGIAAAPLMLPSAPIVQRDQTRNIIAMEPKAAPRASSQDTKPALEPSSSQHDLKGMDLESALHALSTKRQREQQEQRQAVQ